MTYFIITNINNLLRGENVEIMTILGLIIVVIAIINLVLIHKYFKNNT